MTTNDVRGGRQGTAGPGRLVGIVIVFAVAIGVVATVRSGTPTCDDRIPGVRPGICLDDANSRPAASTATGPVLGDPDRTVGLEDLVGDVVVVNFWASWCGPCRREQPDLNAAHDDLRELGVRFLGVNVQDDSVANALAHEREFDIPYPSIDDPSGRYAASYQGVGPRTMPSTVLIDRQGRIAVSLLGETSYDEVVILVRLLADEPS